MASTLRLYINAETGTLLNSGASFVNASPNTFVVGDTVPLELHLVAGAGVAKSPYEVPFPAGSTTKVAIGSVGAIPTAGQWRLSVSGTETADLAYNASASAVQTALNAISPVSTNGGVTVSSLGGGYSIAWNTTGTKPPILAGSDTLAPASYEAIVTLQAGDVSTREIIFVELRQNPIALASSFSPIGTPTIAVSTVSAWNGSNKIVRVAIGNSPKAGQWTLTLGSTSYAFRANAAASDIRQGLGVLSSDVSTTGVNQWDITLLADLAASVNGSALVASDALVGTLSLATSEAIAFLGTAVSSSATLEVSSETTGLQNTLAQASCTVVNSVVAPGAIEPVTAGTPLTVEVANATYARLSSFDQGVKTTDSPTFENLISSGYISANSYISTADNFRIGGSGFDTIIGHDSIVFGANSPSVTLSPTDLNINTVTTNNLVVNAGDGTFNNGSVIANNAGSGRSKLQWDGLLFNSSRKLNDADYGGAVVTGGGGTNITSGNYNAEIYLTIDGTKYGFPARLA